MRLSIVIPTRNRAERLLRAIRSIEAVDYPHERFEVLIVDNCSSDCTRAVLSEAAQGSPLSIRYLYEPRIGAHFARNGAVRHARGEWLYYTDDDVVLDPGVFRAFDRLLSTDRRIAVATGMVVPHWETIPPEWVLRLLQNSLLSLQLRPEVVLVSPYNPGVWSCHQLVRKAVVLECGGFNPDYVGDTLVGDGESGLNARIAAAGHYFGYTCEAKIFHWIPPERMTQSYLNNRLMNQARADVFTRFRAERPTTARLRYLQLESLFLATKRLASSARHRIRAGDAWRMPLARACYEYARYLALGSLIADAGLRQYSLKEGYMDE